MLSYSSLFLELECSDAETWHIFWNRGCVMLISCFPLVCVILHCHASFPLPHSNNFSYRVYRVPGFLSSRPYSVLAPPAPSSARESPPPLWIRGGGGTFACGRGCGGDPIRRKGQALWYSRYKVQYNPSTHAVFLCRYWYPSLIFADPGLFSPRMHVELLSTDHKLLNNFLHYLGLIFQLYLTS